jgi:hypothetical protein
MFTQQQLVVYVNEVRNNLEKELIALQHLMLVATQQHAPQERITGLNQCFKALLAEKARQETIEQIRQHHSRSTQSSSPSPADNTPRRVSTWNVLQQKIA